MSVCVVESSCQQTVVKSNSLIDKINQWRDSSDKFFSLEFYSPRTPSATCNLLEKCDRFVEGNPLFCDVTCDINRAKFDAKGGEDLLTLASATQDLCGVDTMLQLNCSKLTEQKAYEILQQAMCLNLRNVLAIKEAPNSQEEELQHMNSSVDFKYTADLVKFIRMHFGKYFTICVAGYPHSTDDCEFVPYEESLEHLQDEMAAGADFIISQMVFDAEMFINFVKQCKNVGIKAPVIPGILPIQSFNCIKKLSKLSSVRIPSGVMNVLNPIKENDEAVLKYGTFLTVQLCKALLETALVCGLHFYTLNRETATKEILKRVGLWRDDVVLRRVLPWQQCEQNEVRALEESVRPIFWALRPDSYVNRTSQWEEFPNGRWGNSSSSSFGSFKDYHLFFAKNRSRLPQLKKMWGERLESEKDVFDVFAAFISGRPNKNGVKVTNIPWAEDEVALETSIISEQLTYLNENGILTINSQPNVNCASSTDKLFGWGSPGGYVFQKAYLEFFVNEEDALNFLEILPEYPSVHYHIVNQKGSANYTNADKDSSNAVTWGVFTGRPILQPTVVDPIAFEFWKDEAFELWTQEWGKLYPVGSKSHELVSHFHDHYFLVNLVDNDFIKGNCLFDVVDRVISMRSNTSA
eukprot:gene14910-16453_t